jgi:hypothetical protein
MIDRARLASTALLRQRVMHDQARRKLESSVTVAELRAGGLSLPPGHPGPYAVPYDVEVWEDLLWYAWNDSIGINATAFTRAQALASVQRQLAACFGYELHEIRLRVTHLL